MQTLDNMKKPHTLQTLYSRQCAKCLLHIHTHWIWQLFYETDSPKNEKSELGWERLGVVQQSFPGHVVTKWLSGVWTPAIWPRAMNNNHRISWSLKVPQAQLFWSILIDPELSTCMLILQIKSYLFGNRSDGLLLLITAPSHWLLSLEQSQYCVHVS